MQFCFKGLCLTILAVASIASTTYAESPYRARFSGALRFDNAVRATQEKSGDFSLKFAFRIPGEGRIHGVFEEVSTSSVLPEQPFVAHFKGKIAQARHKKGEAAPDWVSATLSREDGKEVISLSFVRISRAGVTRFYKIKKILGNATARVIRAPEYVLYDAVCEEGHRLMQNSVEGDENETFYDHLLLRQPSTMRQVELGIEADHDFIDDFGSSLSLTSSQMTNIVNTARTAYERDLNLTLRLNAISLQTNRNVYPSWMTNPDQLLTTFDNRLGNLNHLGRADAFILFSGKDFDGNTIGLATLGQQVGSGLIGICGAFPTGTIQNLSEATNWVIFAHELGHILGSAHDENMGCSAPNDGIMGTTLLSTIPTGFSACSMAAISNHVSRFGSCLAAVSSGGGPGSGGAGGTVPGSPGGGGSSGGGSGGTPGDGGSGGDSGSDRDSDGGFNGGDTVGGVLPLSPEIRFQATLRDRRELEGQVTVSETGSGCVVEFRASTRKRRLLTGELLGVSTPTSTVVNFAATVTSKVRAAKRARRQRGGRIVHIAAVSNCGGSYRSRLSTGSFRFDASRIRVKERQSLAQWYTNLASNFILR